MQSDQVTLPELMDVESVYTCLRELDKLKDAVYKTEEGGFDEVLESVVNRDLYHAVIEIMKQTGGGNDPQSREAGIERLKAALQAIPVVKLQIAVPLPTKSLKTIHTWVKANLHDPAVLDTEVSPELLGGVRISFNGKFSDKSVAAKWPEVWKAVQEEGKQPAVREGG
jgi:F0F1-type ATP synthase delta subunit